MLRVGYLKKLKCFECDSIFRKEPVKQVCTVSPDLSKECSVEIKRSSDLEQHPELLLFVGHIDRRGQIYFADRWAPLRTSQR